MIYLDNNATTPLLPEVRAAMDPWLGERYGNPSAGYRAGREARRAVDAAREEVARLLGVEANGIVFTGCGTESNNTAIQSALATSPERRHLVITTTEHSAVEEPCKWLEAVGCEVTRVGVDEQGRLSPEAVAEAIRPGETALVSVIWANNETGVISPVPEIAARAKAMDVPCHTDAVQYAGKCPIALGGGDVQMLSLSGHKFHAPKGVGVLFVNPTLRFQPSLLGGGQEDGRRSGTENVAGVVAMGAAARLAREALEAGDWVPIEARRDRLEAGVRARLPDVEVNGGQAERLPSTSNLYFPRVDAEGLLILLDEAGVACSPGSACSTGQVKPSRIIRAMGFDAARARSSVRFSLSRLTTDEEIDKAVDRICEAVDKLRVGLPAGGGKVIFNT